MNLSILFWTLSWIFILLSHFDKCGRNVPKCDELVITTLFGICLLNMVLRSIPCQQDDQIWQISLRTVDFYKTDACKSILQAEMNIFKKCIPSACESVYREIFVPHHETVRLSSKPWDLRGLVMTGSQSGNIKISNKKHSFTFLSVR